MKMHSSQLQIHSFTKIQDSFERQHMSHTLAAKLYLGTAIEAVSEY